ncbi:hypothetical protein N7532_003777 [Penicillium argentinense]|uniref:cellulase n=1 Tax=Penicillium argentinense TaxID=1131581 RepID=A0A9W9FN91_9EURO|nr:uncharacterized protein N7532_003777 [Penicillium argentinense]KAJ5103248.1 hypothetical protein N7532_003777 [Penicillium argentinense]
MKLTSLILLAAAAGSAVAAPVREHAKRASLFQFVEEKILIGLSGFGTNESGAEFGENNLPGVWGTDYIWPDTSTIQTLIDKGMNIFRVQFKMERLAPGSMTGSFNADYLRNLTAILEMEDVWAVLTISSNGAIITSTSEFQTFWQNVAMRPFREQALALAENADINDVDNEYYGMDQTLVLNLNQAAINGIRAAGATSQYIFVEGNSWTGAWTWTSVNDNMKALTDPQDKIVYEMHQYLDSDGSGTSATCVSSTIGEERVSSATAWLRANGKKGILGEFAGGVNDQCKTAVTGMLNAMAASSDVWLGAMWWAAGPWWGSYIFSMEPTSGTAYQGMLATLEPFLG